MGLRCDACYNPHFYTSSVEVSETIEELELCNPQLVGGLEHESCFPYFPIY